MDVLRVLSLADLEVRKKTLTLVLDLITSKNIDEVHTHTHNLFNNAFIVIFSYHLFFISFKCVHLSNYPSIYLTIHPII